MRFEEVIDALRAGKKIRRKTWADKSSICCEHIYSVSLLVMCNDWEIVKEKVKKTVWVNVYKNGDKIFVASYNWDTKEDAECEQCPEWASDYLGARPITVEVDE